MKKKICFFSSNINNSGGTERVASIIANHLSAQNYEIIFLSLFEGLNPHFKFNSNIQFFTLSKTKKSLSKHYISLTLKLRNFLKSENIDCIINIESTLSLFVCPASLLVKTKHINWEHFNFSVSLGKKTRVISRYLALLFADYIITLTDTDKNMWERKSIFPSKKVVTIPNPTLNIINKNNITTSNKKTVISVGRLTEQKGFDLLIKAWFKVKAAYPDWCLWIVGDGEEKENLENKIYKNNLSDVIKLIPFTSNIDSLYKNSNFYVMSSRFEGFPMVLLEACSYGLPIVSFNCLTGPSEIINGNGILVKQNDIEKLALSIIEMIEMIETNNHSYLLYKEKSLEQANLFSIDLVIKKWTNLLERI
ncbi:glycosyltransferase family 4 protein [Providencia sp.]|uniref:glycosyltransferase family 4 protein n=1 Tax=Providencia sp. TaxID=589 RepID=UPI003F975AD1